MLKFRDCDILESETCVTVLNSYLLETDDDIWSCVNFLWENCEGLANSRTNISVFNEIRVHNLLYKRHFKEERTRHTDLEINQNWFMRLLYAIVAKILK